MKLCVDVFGAGLYGEHTSLASSSPICHSKSNLVGIGVCSGGDAVRDDNGVVVSSVPVVVVSLCVVRFCNLPNVPMLVGAVSLLLLLFFVLFEVGRRVPSQPQAHVAWVEMLGVVAESPLGSRSCSPALTGTATLRGIRSGVNNQSSSTPS